jgi:hypothetical protein
LAEPGSTWKVVTPPARAVLNDGSCGQTPCSAQTPAVFGDVHSLPSWCADDPGHRVVAHVRVHVDQPGRDPLAAHCDDARARRRLQADADRLHDAVGEVDGRVLEAGAVAGQHRRTDEQGRLAGQRRIGRGIRRFVR